MYKAAQDFQASVWWRLCEALGTHEPQQIQRVAIRYTVFYCGRKMDKDGFLYAMRYAQDLLTPEKVYWRRGKLVVKAGIGLIPDDDSDHIEGPEVEFVRVKHRDEVKVVMEVILTDA